MRYEEFALGLIRLREWAIGSAVAIENPNGTNDSGKSSLLRLMMTPGTIAASTIAEVTQVVTGVDPTDKFALMGDTFTTTGAVCVRARCITAGTISLGFVNPTAASVVVGAATIYLFQVRQGATSG